MFRSHRLTDFSAAAIALVLAVAGAAPASATGVAPLSQPAATPAPGSPPASVPGPPARLPTLDEVLGLVDDASSPSPGRPRIADELADKLEDAPAEDVFKSAVTLMGDIADRVESTSDVGLDTQRMQEDAIRKLDTLIAQLEQNRSSSSRSQSQQQPEQQQQAPGQQRNQQNSQQTSGENRGENDPPPRQDGTLRPGLDAAAVAWGALPPRVRDMLLQGSSDRYSSFYERLTEAYYRRLAEESRR